MARNKDHSFLLGSGGRKSRSRISRKGKVPSKPDGSTRQWSEEQKKHLTRFDQAKAYARHAISDPVLNEFYAKKAARLRGLGAWHLAIRDFYYPPVIHKVFFQDFHERKGDMIVIHAFDNFEVTRVRVRITGAGNRLIEEGEAVRDPFHIHWRYTLQHDISRKRELLVTVSAFDLPENFTTAEFTRPFVDTVPGPAREWGAKRKQKSQLRPPHNRA